MALAQTHLERAGSGHPSLLIRMAAGVLLGGLVLLGGCTVRSAPPVRGNLARWLDPEAAPETAGPAATAPTAPTSPGVRPLAPAVAAAFRQARREALARSREGGEPPAALAPYVRANRFYLERKYDDAGVELKDLLRRDPTDFVSLCFLANVRLRQGEVDQALAYAERAVARAPSDAESVLMLAQVLTVQGDESRLERAGTLVESLPPGVLAGGRREHILARVRLRQGRAGEARRILEEALKADPTQARLLTDLVELHLGAGRLEAALTLSRRLQEVPGGPRRPRLWLHYRVLRRLGRFREAFTPLKELLEGEGLEAFAATLGGMGRLREYTRLALEERRRNRRLHYLPGELLAVAAGDPKLSNRLAALSDLAGKPLTTEGRGVVLTALKDTAPEVRGQALTLIAARPQDFAKGMDRVLAGLRDPHPQVRGKVATLLARLGRKDLVPTLLERLAAEQDGYAFDCLHGALEALTGISIFKLSGAEEDPEARAALVKQWRRKVGR